MPTSEHRPGVNQVAAVLHVNGIKHTLLVDDTLFTQAAELALADAQPLAHNSYKVLLAKTLIRRAPSALTRSNGAINGHD
jgi:hypothetical protein